MLAGGDDEVFIHQLASHLDERVGEVVEGVRVVDGRQPVEERQALKRPNGFAIRAGGIKDLERHVVDRLQDGVFLVTLGCKHGDAGKAVAEIRDVVDFVVLGSGERGADIAALASATGLPADRFARTMAAVASMQRGEATDPFGRRFDPAKALVAPYIAVKVTGALFHTQGGLVIDDAARVVDHAGTAFPNLLAGGGAARGVSGATAAGYIAGNGLMTATAFGRLAGETAAAIAADAAQEILV